MQQLSAGLGWLGGVLSRAAGGGGERGGGGGGGLPDQPTLVVFVLGGIAPNEIRCVPVVCFFLVVRLDSVV